MPDVPTAPGLDATSSIAIVRAAAKLTLGLRIVGVRDDGYHLIDAEMVSLELARRRHVLRGRRPHARRPVRGGDRSRRHQPRAAGPGRGRPAGRGAGRQADPGRRRTGGRLGRRRRRAALGRHLGCRDGGRARRRRAVLPGGRARPGHWHRRDPRAAPLAGPGVHARDPAPRRVDDRRLPGVGRARWPPKRRAERPRTGRARPRAPAGRVARPDPGGDGPGRRRSRGAVRPGSSRARSRGSTTRWRRRPAW